MCLSSSTNIKSILGGKIATSKHSVEIQKAFGRSSMKELNLSETFLIVKIRKELGCFCLFVILVTPS